MWLLAVIPAVTAAIIGLVTGLSPEIALWKRVLVIGLTVLTICAVITNQWWDQKKKGDQEKRRTEILEHLGSLIETGESLTSEIAGQPGTPIPLFKLNDWESAAETFLKTLGNSYVVRFRSRAGIMSLSWTNANQEQNGVVVQFEFPTARIVR